MKVRTHPETTAGTATDLMSGDARVYAMRALPSGGRVRRDDQADSESTRLAMADLRFAAWFLWMTPLLAALSS